MMVSMLECDVWIELSGEKIVKFSMVEKKKLEFRCNFLKKIGTEI